MRVIVSAEYDRELRTAVSRVIRGQGFRCFPQEDRFTWFRRDPEALLILEIAERARHRWSFFPDEKKERRTPLRVEAAVVFPFLPPSPNYSRAQAQPGDAPDLRDGHLHELLKFERENEWPRLQALIPKIAEGVRQRLLPWVLRVCRPDDALREIVGVIRSGETRGDAPSSYWLEKAESLAKKLGEPSEEWSRKLRDLEAEQMRRLYDND